MARLPSPTTPTNEAETNRSKRDEAIKQGVEYCVMKPDFARLMHFVAHAAGR